MEDEGRKTQVKGMRPCEEENQSSTLASGERPREDLVENPGSALATVKGNRPCVDLASPASAAADAAPASGTVEEQVVALMEIRMPDYAGRKTEVEGKRPCEEENTAASGKRPRLDLVENPSSALATTVKGNHHLASSASAAAPAPVPAASVHGRALMEIRMPDYPVMTDFEDDEEEDGGFVHRYQDGHLVVVGKFPKVVLEGPLNPNALTVEGILRRLAGRGGRGILPADDPYGRAHWGIFSKPSSPTASASGDGVDLGNP